MLIIKQAKQALLAVIAVSALLAAPVTRADTFNLRIGSGHPSGPSVYVREVEKFFVPEVTKRVKERTGHTVTFTQAYGGTIAKPHETLTAVQNGLLDIGAFCYCFESSRMFVNNFPYWVPFGPTSSVMAAKAARKVYDEFPQLSQSLEKYDQKLLGLSGWDNYHLGTTFAWDKLSDMKGKKIGAAGPNLPWLEGSGAVGVSTTLPEVYNAMKSGIFEGIIMFPSGFAGFKFYEPAPNFKMVNFGATTVNAVTINLRTWNKLPKEVQAILAEVGREYEIRGAQALDDSNAAGLEQLKKVGAKLTEMSPDARRNWAEGLKDWPNKMAKEADKRGAPGSAVMKAYLRHLKAEGWKPTVDYVIQ